MKRETILGLAMAIAALSACNRAATNETANGSGHAAAPPANTADAGTKPEPAAPLATAAVAPAGGGTTLDRAYMVGRWTDDGDCTRSPSSVPTAASSFRGATPANGPSPGISSRSAAIQVHSGSG